MAEWATRKKKKWFVVCAQNEFPFHFWTSSIVIWHCNLQSQWNLFWFCFILLSNVCECYSMLYFASLDFSSMLKKQFQCEKSLHMLSIEQNIQLIWYVIAQHSKFETYWDEQMNWRDNDIWSWEWTQRHCQPNIHHPHTHDARCIRETITHQPNHYDEGFFGSFSMGFFLLAAVYYICSAYHVIHTKVY